MRAHLITVGFAFAAALFTIGCERHDSGGGYLATSRPQEPEAALANEYGFPIGDSVVRRVLDSRIVENGAWGGIVRWPALGATHAWSKEESPNFFAPRPPPDLHAEMGRAFLSNHGVRSSEIGAVELMSVREGDQRERTDVTVFRHPVVKLERQIDGFVVPDSYAWAELTDRGAPVAFAVLWPDVPAATVEEARALQTRLAGGLASANAAPEPLATPSCHHAHWVGRSRPRLSSDHPSVDQIAGYAVRDGLRCRWPDAAAPRRLPTVARAVDPRTAVTKAIACGVLLLACSTSSQGGQASGGGGASGEAGAAGSVMSAGGAPGGEGGAAGTSGAPATGGTTSGGGSPSGGSQGGAGGPASGGAAGDTAGGAAGNAGAAGSPAWGPACAAVAAMPGLTVKQVAGLPVDVANACAKKMAVPLDPSLCAVRPPPPNTSGVGIKCVSPDGVSLYLTWLETDEGFCSDGWLTNVTSKYCPGSNKIMPDELAKACGAAVDPASGGPKPCP